VRVATRPTLIATAAIGNPVNFGYRNCVEKGTCAADTSKRRARGCARGLIMAIISCGECSHQVSDRAAKLPKLWLRRSRRLSRRSRGHACDSQVLITLMAFGRLEDAALG